MRKNIFLLKCFSCVLILLCFSSLETDAQSIKRQSIASYGSVSAADNVTIQQTAGQAFNTTAGYNTESSILQGFQQPKSFKLKKVVSDRFFDLNLNIYPNPANFEVNISSTETIENATIQVVNISGKNIYSEKQTELNNHSINCSNWQNGIYLIIVTDKFSNKSVSKLIINR